VVDVFLVAADALFVVRALLVVDRGAGAPAASKGAGAGGVGAVNSKSMWRLTDGGAAKNSLDKLTLSPREPVNTAAAALRPVPPSLVSGNGESGTINISVLTRREPVMLSALPLLCSGSNEKGIALDRNRPSLLLRRVTGVLLVNAVVEVDSSILGIKQASANKSSGNSSNKGSAHANFVLLRFISDEVLPEREIGVDARGGV
jgi:hypothetical protein